MTTLKPIQYRPLSRVICLFSGLLLLAGCGFQLKGSDTENGEAQLDGMTIQLISSQSRSELTREVSRALTAIGLILVTEAEDEAMLAAHTPARAVFAAQCIADGAGSSGRTGAHARR